MTQDRLGAALAAHQAGRLAEAEAGYRAVLAVDPWSVDALRLLALIAQNARHGRVAAALLRRALVAAPALAEPWRDLAAAARSINDGPVVDRALRRALTIDPADSLAWGDAARAAADRGDHADAARCWRCALMLDPADAPAWRGAAAAAHERGDAAGMRRGFARAARLAPGDATTRDQWALCLWESDDATTAEAVLRQALILDPGQPTARMRWAQSLLRVEAAPSRRAFGWRRYEARWETAELAPMRPLLDGRQPWRGEGLAGRRLLVVGEQGLGDMIQGLRHLPALKAAGAHLTLRLPATLHGLARRTGLADDLVDGSMPLPATDVSAPMFALPALLGEGDGGPYLTADPVRAQAFRGGREPGFHVGLHWAGSPTHRLDARRSIAWAALAPLLALPGVRFHSLQTGPAGDAAPPIVTDHRAALTDLDATAALIATLDLVIAIDSAVAHLAGALGVPAWVMLYAPSEWRWGRDADRTPLYRSVRVFRQARAGDWGPVVAAVAAALRGRKDAV